MPRLIIPWTISVIGKTVNENRNGNKTGLVAEFDCDVEVNYWGSAKYEDYGWEFTSITVEWNTPPQKHIITKKSDPALWEIVERGLAADELSLSDRIIEEMCIDDDGDKCDRAYEEYRDSLMERDFWEAGR